MSVRPFGHRVPHARPEIPVPPLGRGQVVPFDVGNSTGGDRGGHVAPRRDVHRVPPAGQDSVRQMPRVHLPLEHLFEGEPRRPVGQPAMPLPQPVQPVGPDREAAPGPERPRVHHRHPGRDRTVPPPNRGGSRPRPPHPPGPAARPLPATRTRGTTCRNPSARPPPPAPARSRTRRRGSACLPGTGTGWPRQNHRAVTSRARSGWGSSTTRTRPSRAETPRQGVPDVGSVGGRAVQPRNAPDRGSSS